MSKYNYDKEPRYERCAWCNKLLPKKRHPKKRFCNDSHRVMFSMKGKKPKNA